MSKTSGSTPAASRSVAWVMRTLAREMQELVTPVVERIADERPRDAFRVLIATMLSAQTRDAVTDEASSRLFRAGRTPGTLARLRVGEIARLIYPVSFYRHKARHVRATCRLLLSHHGGRVPSTMDELLALPGVGRKTANLVLIAAHRSRDNICVDTHVHRIANRLGWVRTRTPDETEQVLYRVTRRRWWPAINLYLVSWGQSVCRPTYPLCGTCAIRRACPQIGVVRKGRPPADGRPRGRAAPGTRGS